MSEDLDARLYFRQLLAGRQVATAHPMAGRMANFMYLLGDRSTREAFVVDPAWDVESLLAVAEADGVTATSTRLRSSRLVTAAERQGCPPPPRRAENRRRSVRASRQCVVLPSRVGAPRQRVGVSVLEGGSLCR